MSSSCCSGFWTAWRAGKAVADGWGDYPLVIVYMLLLGLGDAFLHHALFNGPMFTPSTISSTSCILLVVRDGRLPLSRTNQMVNNYYWLYEKTSAFSWKEKH